MAEKCKLTAKVISNVKLTLIDESLEWGKWNQNPVDRISSNTDGITAFIGQGRDSSQTGTEGTVIYEAEDGTKFKMYFDNPYYQSNGATIVAYDGSPFEYSYAADVPSSGREITATYTINYDAPQKN